MVRRQVQLNKPPAPGGLMIINKTRISNTQIGIEKMKLSLKLQENQTQNQNQNQNQHHYFNPVVTAKIPISMFNHPFLTSISSTISDSSHLSLSLSSNFASGPSLKLSYSPTSTAASLSPPFSLSLKSGLGLFGSPRLSPLVFTAHFSFSSPNPTFSLLFNPQLGNFSLKKTTLSNPNGGPVSDLRPGVSGQGFEVNPASGSASNGGNGNGFVPEGPSVWRELKLEPFGAKNGDFQESFGVYSSGGTGKGCERDGFLSGIAVMARTVFPVTKKVKMNMRWGVNLPSDLGSKMPYLKLNKIGIERVEEAKEEEEKEKEKRENKETSDVVGGDLELLKGMCFWMRRDLEVLERENREMKGSLEQMKFGVSAPGGRSGGAKHLRSNSAAAAAKMPWGESSSEFERWRSGKNVKEESGKEEPKKPANQASDLKSELERAIKAAATVSSST